MPIPPSFFPAPNSRECQDRRRFKTGAVGGLTIALIGNPNAGKTTLFNVLTGLRAKTSNFPGTTVEHRQSHFSTGRHRALLIDLPGLYSLDAVTPEEKVARDALKGCVEGIPEPDCIVVVVDATNLERNLFLVGQILELKRPVIVALNMMDSVQREGIRIDLPMLEEQLGCPVIPVSAKAEMGMDELVGCMDRMLSEPRVPAVSSSLMACGACEGCQYAARYNWAEQVVDRCGTRDKQARGRTTEAIDHILTHPVVGVVAFLMVMLLTFVLIFWIAQYPMGWIDLIFAHSGALIRRVVPPGLFQSLLVDGILGGVGGMLVFLPQICILFFVLSLLEDTGYLARAAFVMDRLMHRVGLPGKAFVPLLSAHACAVPAILATRVIEDRRDRLATIMIAPLMSCSARVPVYAMVIALLVPRNPLKAAGLFAAAYVIGISVGLLMALVFKKTLLKGETKPLVIELPSYRMPSLRSAWIMTLDRALVFLSKAGTVILVISVVLWAMATFPRMERADLSGADHAHLDGLRMEASRLRVEASGMEVAGRALEAEVARREADAVDGDAAVFMQRRSLEFSWAGRMGRLIEPVMRPLGFDWKISIGIVSSFAAREVIVSTLSVLYGVGDGGGESKDSLYDALRTSTWEDGSPVFTWPASLSLLVFYILAMQCLPTLVVTLRETGAWRWPLIQFGYMSLLAYIAAWITYRVAMLVAANGGIPI